MKQAAVKSKQVTADVVVKLLAERHAEDVFVPECKDGPTQSGPHMRLDAWAMKKSWAHPAVFGYEVKVSRSDFLGDDKWRGYLRTCNSFYWVCPQGLISLSEVAEEAGLIYVTSSGGRLYMKKKAPYRDVVIPESIWRYILMCRARIGAETEDINRKQHGREYWQKWLTDRATDKELGYMVSRAVRGHVEDVERESRRLEKKMAQYDDVRATLQKLGWTAPDKEWIDGGMVNRKISTLREIVPPHVISQLEQAGELARRIAQELKGAAA